MFFKNLTKIRSGPKAKILDPSIPKLLEQTQIQILISFEVLSWITANSQTRHPNNQEIWNLNADPGINLSSEALIFIRGQSKPMGLNSFLKTLKLGPSLTEISAGYMMKWCYHSSHFLAVPGLRPDQVLCPFALLKGKDKAKRTHWTLQQSYHYTFASRSRKGALAFSFICQELSQVSRCSFLWK